MGVTSETTYIHWEKKPTSSKEFLSSLFDCEGTTQPKITSNTDLVGGFNPSEKY